MQISHFLNATYDEYNRHASSKRKCNVNQLTKDGIEFNITAFDLAGNSLTVNQTQLDSPNLTIDENVPSVTNLLLYSNYHGDTHSSRGI